MSKGLDHQHLLKGVPDGAHLAENSNATIFFISAVTFTVASIRLHQTNMLVSACLIGTIFTQMGF